ncbi:MAG: GDYXXLXY domain-containing protein [Bacillota bacterium]
MRNIRWFIIALAVQILLVITVPLPRLYVLLAGKTVLLETLPADPYDIFSGYYAQLGYKISDIDELPFPPDMKRENHYDWWRTAVDVYVVLAPDEEGIWQPKRVQKSLPRHLGANEAVIKGRYNWRVEYGIERYYLPESQRKLWDKMMRDRENRPVVEAKVDKRGNAAIVRIKVGGKIFKY